MKKFGAVVLCFMICGAASAFERGGAFGVGIDSGIVLKPYAFQRVAFCGRWDNGLGFETGVKFYENIIKGKEEPLFYFAPEVDFKYKAFYLGGGVLLNDVIWCSQNVSFLLKTGLEFEPWDWGSVKGGFNVGLEMSPMIVKQHEGSNDVSSGLSDGFSSLFNIIKLNLGFNCYLPF